MGFIGGSLVLENVFTSSDKKDAYYLIDGLNYESDTIDNEVYDTNNSGVLFENIKTTILFSVFTNREDRLLRKNCIETRSYERSIKKSEIDTITLSDYYIYCKPLIIDDLKKNVAFKLGLDISDEIPSEYTEYYTLTDHL
tara:strand:- start:69 stop:488 length:420 start_codon:yes stop_codon:yes gene_type:complete